MLVFGLEKEIASCIARGGIINGDFQKGWGLAKSDDDLKFIVISVL